MVQSDPYQRWSAAPKHWIELPVQRQTPDAGTGPPAERRPLRPPALRAFLRRPVVVAVLVAAAAVLLLTLAGPGTSVAMLDAPAESAP